MTQKIMRFKMHASASTNGKGQRAMSDSPVRPYKALVLDSGTSTYMNRLMVGTACTGLLRVEWYSHRTGLIVPCNWSQVSLQQFMSDFMPLRYQVADAQNLIAREAIDKDFEWLLLYEHDVLPPSDAFVRLNQYMVEEKVPLVSGLYFSRSRPAEPLIFRGRGTSYYADWKLGDRVYCDGVPTGFLLIHCAILRLMWDESPEDDHAASV